MKRVVVTIALAGAASAAPSRLEQRLHVRVPMSDGARLCANVFLPPTTGRFPAILIRTPYGKGGLPPQNYSVFLERGYALVIQDVRGRHDSEGVFRPPEQESGDGDETINWIARQPWSDGNVGMTGGSYLGIAQWQAAAHNNPHLKAIFPVVAGSDEYLDRYYSRGGAFKLGHRLLWFSENMRAAGFRPDFNHYVLRLPIRAADVAATGRRLDLYQRALDHPAYDSFWQSLSSRERLNRIAVPVFAVGGWYDNYVESDLEAFSLRRKASRVHRLLVGPWAHSMTQQFPGVDFGPDAMPSIRALQLAWFEERLKSPQPVRTVASSPPLRIFVMGSNRWRDEQEWPLARTRLTRFYLRSGGHANSLKGDGELRLRPESEEETDRFVYDPRRPVPTRGGAVCCNPKVFAWGPLDQRPVEARADVLVYTSPPLEEDLEVTGPIRLVLYVSTSAPDTDFTAKVVDVFPDGEARNLTDGILRLRYRESMERPLAAEPGKVYRITIEAGVTSNVFRAGHRLRLEISSSNFPRFDRNLNTGRAQADETEIRVAEQTVHHGPRYPSHALLPVIPQSESRGRVFVSPAVARR